MVNGPTKAKISDVVQIHRLINHFANQQVMLPRSLSEIYENIRDFFVVKRGQRVIACAALHVTWEDLAEVRSVAVKETYQRRGIGTMLVEACLKEAEEIGLKTVFCLSYKPEFFEACNFHRVEKSQLPQKVWGECYRCPKFPDCDEVALIYYLERES